MACTACGTPTLVARTGSLPDLVGDAGAIVDPNDEAEISSALEALWADAEALGFSFAAVLPCLSEQGDIVALQKLFHAPDFSKLVIASARAKNIAA